MLDAPTFLLLLLALMGRRGRHAVLAVAARRGVPISLALFALAGGCFALFALTGALQTRGLTEEQGLLMLALLQVGAIVAFLGSHGVLRRAWSRGVVRLGLAVGFHAFFIVSAPNIRFEAGDSVTPLWFVDLTASGWVTFIEPILSAVGAGGTSTQVLGLLTPGLAFLGAAVVPFQFVWSYVALGWIVRLVPPDTYPEEVSPEPAGVTGWVVGLLAVAALLAQGPDLGLDFRVLARGLAALFALHGAWWLFAHLASRCAPRWTLSLVAACAVVLFVYPLLWWLIGALGVLEPSSRRWRRSDEALGRLTASCAAWLRRSFGPAVLVGFALPVIFAGGAITQLVRGAPAVRSVAPPLPEADFPGGSSFRVPGPDGRHFEVDRYEFPNQRGVMPKVGVRPEVAQADCEARGARLCTAEELGLVCASGRDQRFLGGGEQGFLSGETVLRLEAQCNFGRTEGGRTPALLPSGASPACRGDWAVYDLVGNANEWAALPERPGFYALVGSDYRYDDLLLLTCGAYMLIPTHFIDHVDLRAVGSRCCR